MDFVTIDFETANYSRKSACAIGMVKYRNEQVVDNFYSLIKPPRLYIRPDFTEIHGITYEDVKDAPTFAELWGGKIYPFIRNIPIAAHNANFDISVLLAALKWYGLPNPSIQYFCSLQLARHTWKTFESYGLQSIANKFKITYKAHNALEDAETCGKIILMAAEEHDVTSIQDLINSANIEMKEIK